ncbi:MAG: chemotaxis protein CheX [Leptospirales bacterium]
MVDPFLDEKVVLVLSSSVMELATGGLQVEAVREAYGVTRNEGLCYEFCSAFSFSGEIVGDLYIGMDGYTKILLLPYITKNFEIEVESPEMVKNATRAFVERMKDEFILELHDILPGTSLGEVRNLNFKLVSLPSEKYRKYTVIFFLKDTLKKKYLGRIYFHVVFEKVYKTEE